MRRRESGYALLVVVFLVALVLVALSAAVPRLLTQGQREKEEELIFRGEQYRRAIGRFYKKLGRYPLSVEELRRTNNLSFLRREFPDPMTREGTWRLIRVGPSGEFIGSVTPPLPARPAGPQRPESRGSSEKRPDTPGTAPASPGGSPGGAGSLPLAGVASRSQARSIRVFQGFAHYHEWEFVYDPTREAVVVAPGAAPAPSPPASPPPR